MGQRRIHKMIEEIKPILDATSDAICIMSEDQEVLYSNSFYKNMARRGSAELVSDKKDIYVEGKSIGQVVVYHDISEINRLRKELNRTNQRLRKVQDRYTFKDIIGQNVALLKVIKKSRIVAMTPATILIRGESGTGKEIFANAIHNSSHRQNESFIKINCSSLPEDLLESELFGYKEGAFTGASRGGRKGLFEEADKGTIFLDEIGDVSAKMQVRLLRVLQEKEVTPVGSTLAIPIDVRIIAATNKPLEKMVKEGVFREDLYYRLNVFPLSIPPLRERIEDIEAIARYLINKYSEFYCRTVKDIQPQAIDLLKEMQWQGNVRELENVLSRSLINANSESEVLTESDILLALGCQKKAIVVDESDGITIKLPTQIKAAVALAEKKCIENALKDSKGDKNQAAYALGIPLRTLYYKCQKNGL